MKIKIFCLITSTLFHFSLHAQNRPEDISNAFLKTIKVSGKDSGLVELYKYLNPTDKQQLDQSIRNQFKKIDSLDKLNDWLWICDMELTRSLILKSYLLKYDHKPYRLNILYYKKINIWYIQETSIDNDLFSDLKNAGRAEKLRPNNLIITY